MKELKNSFLFKSVAFLILVILLVLIMYFGRALLVPFTFATLFSIILLPICKRLEKWKLGRVIPAVLSILILLIIVSLLFFFLITQVKEFTEDLDQVSEVLLKKVLAVHDFIRSKTGYSQQEQLNWINGKYEKLIEESIGYIKAFVLNISQFLFSLSLVLIGTFFFLMYRDRYKTFILKIFDEEHHDKVQNIIIKIKNLIYHYLTGLLIAQTILGTLNAIGLSALGIRQAIFLGYLAGYLNIIPYVGTMLGGLLNIFVSLIFKDSALYALGVFSVMSFNQFIDYSFTTPNIMGSHVSVNPLAIIVSVIIGGYIWGIAGMILFIPLTGVFKIICDNIEPLKPIGYLLGEYKGETKPGFFAKLFSKGKMKNNQ